MKYLQTYQIFETNFDFEEKPSGLFKPEKPTKEFVETILDKNKKNILQFSQQNPNRVYKNIYRLVFLLKYKHDFLVFYINLDGRILRKFKCIETYFLKKENREPEKEHYPELNFDYYGYMWGTDNIYKLDEYPKLENLNEEFISNFPEIEEVYMIICR